MDTQTDMTYRFLWNIEPTDEQLLVIMKEVEEEARQNHEKIAKQVIESIERESLRLRSVLNTQL